MKIAQIIATVALVAAASVAHAGPFEKACSKLKAEVNLTSAEFAAPRMTARTIRELTATGKEGHQDHVAGHALNLGWTRATWNPEYGYNFSSLEKENGEACVVGSVEGQLGFADIEMSIAKELGNNTCSYNEVVEHEMRHFDAYNKHIHIAAKAAAERIAALLKDKVFYGKTKAAAIEQANAYMDGFVETIVHEELKKARELHAAIDTVEEYEHASNMCNGEMQRMLKKNGF